METVVRTRISSWKRKTIAGSICLASVMLAAAPLHAGNFIRSASIGTGSGPGSVNITTSDSWQTLLSIVISQSHSHICQAVASLDAINPDGNVNNQFYHFTISVNNANPSLNADAVERTIELRNQSGIDDPSFWPVSTNRAFTLTNGTIRLLGRKFAGAPNLPVDDAHLSILCVVP